MRDELLLPDNPGSISYREVVEKVQKNPKLSFRIHVGRSEVSCMQSLDNDQKESNGLRFPCREQ